MTCSEAALNGHLECLKYAHESGCPWSEWTCTRAAEGGHLECLKYLAKTGVLRIRRLVLKLTSSV